VHVVVFVAARIKNIKMKQNRTVLYKDLKQYPTKQDGCCFCACFECKYPNFAILAKFDRRTDLAAL